MMEVALSDGVLCSAERNMLEQFKARHKIGDEVHAAVLQELGWTGDDFKSGRRRKR